MPLGRTLRGGPMRRGLAVLVVLTVATAVQTTAPPSAAPAAPPPVAPSAADTAIQPTEAAALAMARQTGMRVAVASLRTETQDVYANPSGTLTMEQHTLPVRVRQGA